MPSLNGYVAVYGILAVLHLVVQTLFAHLEHLRQKRRARAPAYGRYRPTATVVVPVYNEDSATLRRCLNSLVNQDYHALEVVLVDDGSPDQETLLPLYDEFAGERFQVLLSPDNRGKRHAQALALNLARGDIIITVDSDTVLRDRDTVRHLVQAFEDHRVGAVTGEVAVENRRHNLLTLLIGYRYWSAFNQERAAQSLFGVVMCCSGPLAAYRRSVLDAVLHRYTSQRFRGKHCTFGDDRHLTNLVLEEGHDVAFSPQAVADTAAPTNLPTFLRQQTRWNKSFFREVLWTLRFARRRHPYLLADLACQVILPLMLLGALGHLVHEAITQGGGRLAHYFLMVAGIGMLRAGYGIARTRDPGFVVFALYGFIHLLLIKPISLYALVTIGRTHWGTRTGSQLDPTHSAPSETNNVVSRHLTRPPSSPLGPRYEINAGALADALIARRRMAMLARRIASSPPMQGSPPVISLDLAGRGHAPPALTPSARRSERSPAYA